MADISIALNRFGYGARPNDPTPDDAKHWLTAQFDHYDARPPAIAAAPTSMQVADQLATYLAGKQANGQRFTPRPPAPSREESAFPKPAPAAAAQPPSMAEDQPATAMAALSPMLADQAMPRAGRDAQDPATMSPSERQGLERIKEVNAAARALGRDNYLALIGARADAVLASDTPFMERLVHFWANHFAISADKIQSIALCGTLEMEAIRPRVLGTFGDMLNAVEHHPAMLLYLDQAQSIGPNSAVATRINARGRRNVGLNENLTREIMELHTLGVRTGYTQADVTEFARAMTGWTVRGIGKGPGAKAAGLDDGKPGEFVFADALHEPGARTIMGKTYRQPGEAQAQAVLDDLAVHPATASHVATKLARHFTGDVPPPAMVARLQAAFLHSRGDLPTVYRALIDSPEAWTPQSGKFKSPWDWSISAYRAVGTRSVQPLVINGLTTQLGQQVWKPGSPAGFDDVTGTWAGPDAVLRRVEAAQRFGAQAGVSLDARALAPKLFPAALSASTGQALERAESPQQALALLLVSPEFMRR